MEPHTAFAETLKLFLLSIFFFVAIFFVYTFGPVISNELGYYTKDFSNKVTGLPSSDVKDIDRQFSIFIPKIDAYSTITPNVNLFDPQQYLPVLRKNIAHVEGTVLPGQNGNFYLVAHSADAFYNAGRYNADFYLLNKLEPGDDIYVYYFKKNILYKVESKQIITPGEVDYFETDGRGKSLTIQSGYPPGTFINRLIIKAKQSF